MELPDGATFSDHDEKNNLNPNDPHLALGNINLDDVEFYDAKSTKLSSIETPEPAKTKDKSHHRKIKKNEPVLLIDESEKRKKKAKKPKREKNIDEMNLLEVQLPLQPTSSSLEKSERKVKKSKKKKKSSKKDEDGESKKKIETLYDEFSKEL